MRINLRILICLFLFAKSATAQLVGGDNVFLSGSYLEDCVSPNGSLGNTQNVPAAYNTRPGVFPSSDPVSCATPPTGLAEMYNFAHTFPWNVPAAAPGNTYGDYTLPGSPWEGWAIEIAGTQDNAWYTDLFCGGGYFSTTGAGAIALTLGGQTYEHDNGGCMQSGTSKSYWTGSDNGVNIDMETRIDTNASWVVMTVKLTNTTGAAINDIYYMRTCDPDDDEILSGNFATNNTIFYNQPLAGTGNRVLVTSQGQTYSNAYLGLGTKDCRAHCFIAESWPDFSGYNADQYWASAGAGAGNTYTQGRTDNGDFAIGLVFNVGSLAAGDSTFVCYSYMFDGSGTPPAAPTLGYPLDSAFPNPKLVVNCAPPTGGVYAQNDTINMCTYTGTTATVNILGGGDKLWTWSTWTWAPATGLATTTGFTNTINIASLTNPVTTYTIIGTTSPKGSSCPVLDTFYVTVLLCNGIVASEPCLGDTLFLTSVGTNSTISTFSWTGPAGFSSTLQNPYITNVTFADSGLYTLIVNTGGALDTYHTHAYIKPLPVVNASTNAPFCYHSTDTMHLYVNPDSTGETFSWTGPVGFVSTLQDPTIDSFTTYNVGTYVVTAVLNGCVNTGSVYAGFMPEPMPPAITGDTAYCYGQAFAGFTVAGVNIVWFPTDTAFTGGTTTYPIVNTTAPGFYTYFARQYPGGCVSAMDSITVHVYPQIIPYFQSRLFRGCFQDSVAIYDMSSNATHAMWNFGDGSANFTDPKANDTFYHIYTPPGNYILTLTAYNADPVCSESTSAQVDTSHPISAMITLSPSVQCVGQEVNVSAVGSQIGYEGLTYYWSFGNSTNSTNEIDSTAYYVAGNYQVNLTVTDALGCQAKASTNVTAVSAAITAWSDTTFCLTAPVPMTNYITLLPNGFVNVDSLSFLWTNPGGGHYGLSDATVQIPTFEDTGNAIIFYYTVTINEFGLTNCIAQHTFTINSIQPPVYINITPTQYIKLGQSVQLNSMMNVNLGPSYYWWEPDNGTLNNLDINDPIATPSSTTTYIVHGMDAWGCVVTDTVVIHVDSTVNDNIPSAFTPNGDGLNDFFLPYNNSFEKVVEFSVFNRWGTQIYHSSRETKGWDGTYNGVPQDMDTYNYIIILAHPDGTNVQYTGTVTLIR